MPISVAAFVGGLRLVLRAPLLLAIVFGVTTAVTVPFTVWAAAAGEGQAVADTMAHVGFDAVLANLSAVLDGTLPSTRTLAATAVYAAIWIPLWTVVLQRFVHSDWPGTTPFFRAAAGWLVQMAQLTMTGLLIHGLLFVGLHPLMFDHVYGWLEVLVTTEQAALTWRIVLYALFGCLLLLTSLVVDFARIIVVANAVSAPRALAGSVRFIRQRVRSVIALTALVGAVLAALLIAYGAFDLSSRGASRAITALVMGQLLILARITIRLVAVASQVRLVQLAAAGTR